MSWWVIALLILGFPMWIGFTVICIVTAFYHCRELHFKRLKEINDTFSKENLKIQKDVVNTLATLMDNLKTMRESEAQAQAQAQAQQIKPIIN